MLSSILRLLKIEQATSPPFDMLLRQYATVLAVLEGTAPQPTIEQILDVLVARDAVQAALAGRVQDFRRNLKALISLDMRLKKQAETIAQVGELDKWRTSLNPPAEAWWWFFEASAQNHRSTRFDWLWGALGIVWLTAAFGLVVDVAVHFLSIGPDTLGAFAIIVEGAIVILAAGGVLTQAGREIVEFILTNLKIPKRLWQGAKLSFAVLLLLGLVAFRLSLPRLAVFYNNRGLDNYLAGRLTSAQLDYTRAIQLNSDYAEAHYNLGLLYEDMQDFDQARKEYRIAAQGGLHTAYNNLARLYILDGNDSAAVSLLLTVLDPVREEMVRYDMLKNLGWARLGQARYAEAEMHLRSAINLASDQAPAHCLLAQALEGEGDTAGAMAEWEYCLKYAAGNNPDEDTWIGIARKRFEAGGEK